MISVKKLHLDEDLDSENAISLHFIAVQICSNLLAGLFSAVIYMLRELAGNKQSKLNA